MDSFITKENYKGKKPNPGPFVMELQLLKVSKYRQFPFLNFRMTSLYITQSEIDA